jgi:hypothetical protein
MLVVTRAKQACIGGRCHIDLAAAKAVGNGMGNLLV